MTRTSTNTVAITNTNTVAIATPLVCCSVLAHCCCCCSLFLHFSAVFTAAALISATNGSILHILHTKFNKCRSSPNGSFTGTLHTHIYSLLIGWIQGRKEAYCWYWSETRDFDGDNCLETSMLETSEWLWKQVIWQDGWRLRLWQNGSWPAGFGELSEIGWVDLIRWGSACVETCVDC